jgi:hypothetical protein
VEGQVRSQMSQCGFCDGHSGTSTCLPLNTSAFTWQYHSTNAPYSYITHLSPLLYNLCK